MKHECEGKREQNVENLKKKTKGKRTQATIEKRKKKRERGNKRQRTNKQNCWNTRRDFTECGDDHTQVIFKSVQNKWGPEKRRVT